MTICEKEYTVSVAEPISIPVPNLYWKLEEPSGDRIDAIQSLPWNPNPGFPVVGPYAPPPVIDSAPGIIDQGAHFTQTWKPLNQRLDTAGSNPNGTADLAFSGFFDVCFWIKFTAFGVAYVVDGTTVGFAGEVRMLYSMNNFPSAGSDSVLLLFTGDLNFEGAVDHYQRIQYSLSDTVDFEPVLDTWYFIRWFFGRSGGNQSSPGQFGLQINNGTVHLESGTRVISNYTRGLLSFTQSPNQFLNPVFGDPTAVAEQFVLDEVPFFNNLGRNLTLGERNYLYNGGVGRTYPFT